jgi:histidine ammonia-lyase
MEDDIIDMGYLVTLRVRPSVEEITAIVTAEVIGAMQAVPTTRFTFSS